MGPNIAWLLGHYCTLLTISLTSLVTITIGITLVEQVGLVEAFKVPQLTGTLPVVSQPV